LHVSYDRLVAWTGQPVPFESTQLRSLRLHFGRLRGDSTFFETQIITPLRAIRANLESVQFDPYRAEPPIHHIAEIFPLAGEATKSMCLTTSPKPLWYSFNKVAIEARHTPNLRHLTIPLWFPERLMFKACQQLALSCPYLDIVKLTTAVDPEEFSFASADHVLPRPGSQGHRSSRIRENAEKERYIVVKWIDDRSPCLDFCTFVNPSAKGWDRNTSYLTLNQVRRHTNDS
jgi:hypothetical protein